MKKKHVSQNKISRVCSIVALLVSCAVLCCACGNGNGGSAGGKTIEGDLSEIMARIYEGVDIDAETKQAMQEYVCDTLTADNEEAILGVADVPYKEGVYSVPMISSIAYQCVLLRVEPGDVETVKTMLKDNADVNKWVCVSAETVLVENVGDVVLFIMSSKDSAYAVSSSFQALAK